MRKTGLFAIAAVALILVGVGGWGASNTLAARVATATSIGINPLPGDDECQISGHGALSGFFRDIPLKPTASISQGSD
jgi:hypothetical protein